MAMDKLFSIGVALFIASCGVPDSGSTPDAVPKPVKVAQAISTPLTGSALLPADRTCAHMAADGTCMVPTALDEDADGVPIGQDCNDHDPYTYPGAKEMRCDGVDENCDGEDYCPPDMDHDGFSPPADCDDRDPNRNPRAAEIFCNAVDENCNGIDDCDADGDGESVPHDCNDGDVSISPHAKEIMCDGIDQNCDGTDCCNNDQDHDGAPCQNDCDDTDPRAYPGAVVRPGCYDKDINCDGIIDGVCR